MSKAPLAGGSYSPVLIGPDEAGLEEALGLAEAYSADFPSPRRNAPHMAVAYVPVDPALVFSGIYSSVGEEIDCLGRSHGVEPRGIVQALRLGDIAGKPTDELSCGQAVRAAVGVAAASNPTVWVLDRCFEWLEEEHRETLGAFLRGELQAGRPVIEISARSAWFVQGTGPGAAGASRPDRQIPSGELALSGRGLIVRRGSFELGPLDMDIFSGERLAILGPNGAGKSSIALALAGLLPFEGKVEAFGRAGDGRSRKILYSFQRPDDQLFRATVREELTETARRVDGYDEARVDDLVHVLRFESLLDKDPFSLPLGARRLLTIGSVLAAQCPAVILDEPSAFLSEWELETLQSALTWAQAQGTAVVAITHDPDFTERFADRVICIGSPPAAEAPPPSLSLGE
jgi:energy-coupling factor transporter ATP-binding protein EcfA2